MRIDATKMREICKYLVAHGWTIAEISRETEIPYSTVWQIANGIHKRCDRAVIGRFLDTAPSMLEVTR